MNKKMENFERAFQDGMAGCVRTCACGRQFYDASRGYDWEDGEFERLEKNKNATPLDYSVGTITLEGNEYVLGCDCWHKIANRFINLIDGYSHQIAEYLTLEKKRKQSDADHSAVVK